MNGNCHCDTVDRMKTRQNVVGYRLEEQVGFLLRLANQRHTTIFQANTVKDLTPRQFSALVRVAELAECSQNLLGRKTNMDASTIKGVVERLRRKKLVELKPDSTDRRRKLIVLTAAGAALVGKLHEVGLEITRETLMPLSTNEQTEFLKLLAKLT